MSPKTSSHSTPLPKCTLLTCLEFAFSNPPHLPLLLCFSYEITPFSPPTSDTQPIQSTLSTALEVFHMWAPGASQAGPRAPQMRVDGESSTAGVHGFAVFRIVSYRFVFLQRQCSTIVERFGIWNCDGNCTVTL